MMPRNQSSCETHQHGCSCSSNIAAQSLDELEFERGIWNAAQYGELEKVKELVDGGRCGVDQRDSAGYTALHYAARNGHLETCKFLVQRGANVDAITRSGQATALHRACSAGKTDVVNFLLTVKADASLQDGDGKTALHRAAESGHQEICRWLTSRFPHLKDIADNKGCKPKTII